jgi:retron-type reverse transcriptase
LYGFRPGSGQQDALDALIVGISSRKKNFILDADIRSFFTEVSQQWPVRFLEHRIGDKRMVRLVQKWLREFSLSLHPDKTRLIELGRFAVQNRERRGLGKPESFKFLGFGWHERYA